METTRSFGIDLARSLEEFRRTRVWPAGAVRSLRDLSLMEVGSLTIVVACDANASTGRKPADHLQQDPRVTGYSAAKVPLMEVLAAGAAPILLVNNLCVRLDDYGQDIVRGIEDALQEAGSEIAVTGSDETNMTTTQTGVGTTVIGVAVTSQLLLGGSHPGDVVVCLGTPKDGLQLPYREGDPDIATVRHVRAVVESGLAHEVLPVGSRGVRFEAGLLAQTSGLRLLVDSHLGPLLDRSSGASTCFLVGLEESRVSDLRAVVDLPAVRIGTLV